MILKLKNLLPDKFNTKYFDFKQKSFSNDDFCKDLLDQIKSSYDNCKFYKINICDKIGFKIPDRTNVKIVVYNSLGQQVRELLNTVEDAGYHEVEFKAQNLASGVYFYTLSAGHFHEAKKMSILK